MTVDNLLSMNLRELQALKRDDLAREVGRLASAANKRLKRLQESDVESQAERYVSEHGGKFSVRGKDKDALLSEYMRAREFMKAQTSTVRGARQAKKHNIESLVDITKASAEQWSDILSDKEVSKAFWGAVDMLRESDIVEKGSVQLINAVYESIDNTSLAKSYENEYQKAIKEGFTEKQAKEEATQILKEEIYSSAKSTIDETYEEMSTDDFGWSGDKVSYDKIDEARETAFEMLLERGYSYREANRMSKEIVQEAINELEEV